MSVLWTLVILLAVNAVAISAMLLVRRGAPEGSRFKDGDRASGVFGVLAGGFAIFAGFIIFLAFTTYDQSRTGGEAEALTVVQQFETAQFLPPAERNRLSGQLVCYGRSVVHREWPQMEAGERRRRDQPVGGRAVQEPQARAAGDGGRAGGVQQVARSDLGPGERPARPAARGGGHHPGLDLARAAS